MTVFWDVAPCVLVESYRRFRGAIRAIALMEAVSTSETSVNFYEAKRLNNPEDSHLHTRRREILKPQLLSLISNSTTARIFKKVLYNHLESGSKFPDKDSNRGSLEYEARAGKDISIRGNRWTRKDMLRLSKPIYTIFPLPPMSTKLSLPTHLYNCFLFPYVAYKCFPWI
jgi:hypothetical protein